MRQIQRFDLKNIEDFNMLLDQSVLGKFFGSFCALVGVFTITLPIPIGRHQSGRIIKTWMEEKKRILHLIIFAWTGTTLKQLEAEIKIAEQIKTYIYFMFPL